MIPVAMGAEKSKAAKCLDAEEPSSHCHSGYAGLCLDELYWYVNMNFTKA
jgi:hypothetical protein